MTTGTLGPGPGDDVEIYPNSVSVTYDTQATIHSLLVTTPEVGPASTLRFISAGLDVTDSAHFGGGGIVSISGGQLNTQGGLARPWG
jgi:hypothetical protein